MSVNSPETRIRARLKRLVRWSAVFAITLGVCGFAPTSADADDKVDANQKITVHVAAGAHGTVAPGDATSVVFTVQNGADSELSSGNVLVELSRTPLADNDALSKWLNDADAGGDFVTLGVATTDPVDPGDSGPTHMFVAPGDLGSLAPGVYPVRATLTGATTGDNGSDGEATATTILVVTSPRTAPLGVLVPITATPADGVLLTPEELTALTAPDGALTALLDGVTGTTAVLAIDPAIVAAIRVLGSAAPTQATAWLSRLTELPNERFALQFGDADPATQAHAGLSALLRPGTLSPFLNPANFPMAPVTATPGTTASPTPAPTVAPAIPDDEELTAIDGALPGFLWPRDDVTNSDVAAFADYIDADTTTIVPSSVTSGRTSAYAQSDGRDLLVTDSAASRALSKAAGQAHADARQRTLAETAAHIFYASQSEPNSPLLIGLERDETRPADALREAISAVDSYRFTLDALRETPPTSVSITSEPQETRATALITLLDDELTLTDFSTILSDPNVLLTRERIQILRTLGVGVADDSFVEAVAEHRKQTQRTLTSVSIPPSSTIQLLTTAADLPFRVRNDLPWPVTIQLSVSSPDPRLDVKPMTEATVQANSSMRVKVPVTARVGSGEQYLKLSLSSSSGVPIGGARMVQVSVRAEWEGIGLAILGGLVVVLLSLGIVRTVRRKGRESVADAASEAARE